MNKAYMKEWKNVALVLIVSTFAVFVVLICRQFIKTLQPNKVKYNDIDSDSESGDEKEIELSMQKDVIDSLTNEDDDDDKGRGDDKGSGDNEINREVQEDTQILLIDEDV